MWHTYECLDVAQIRTFRLNTHISVHIRDMTHTYKVSSRSAKSGCGTHTNVRMWHTYERSDVARIRTFRCGTYTSVQMWHTYERSDVAHVRTFRCGTHTNVHISDMTHNKTRTYVRQLWHTRERSDVAHVRTLRCGTHINVDITDMTYVCHI